MEKWEGKLAVVTGASSGIGAAIVKDFATHGINVVGLARRVEMVEKLADDLKSASGKVYALECDVSDQESVKQAFKWVEDNLGGVDILVNNAGVYKFISIFNHDENTNDELKKIIDINLMGMVYCARAAFTSMIKRNDYGYIINMNSITGHSVPFPTADVPSYNIYAGSKYAVTATTEVMRQEITCMNNKKIRVGSLSPGEVRTDMIEVSGFEGNVDEYFETTPVLSPFDISQGVIYMLSSPAHVQVAELTLRPVGERA
ncbi:unnamed protein product [Diamesa serratosioi]